MHPRQMSVQAEVSAQFLPHYVVNKDEYNFYTYNNATSNTCNINLLLGLKTGLMLVMGFE